MNRSRWRKLGLRVGLGLLALALVLFVSTRFVVRSILHSRADRIETMLRSARSVRLEEFSEGKTLSKKSLDGGQLKATIRSIRGGILEGSLLSLKMCFVPHHRIVATDTTGVDFAFTICFACDQAQIDGSRIFDLSAAWSSSLRRLFQQNGMSVEEAQE